MPSVLVVDDPRDPRVDAFRGLKDATARQHGTFIAESELVLRRVLGDGADVLAVLAHPRRIERLRDQHHLHRALDRIPEVYAAPPDVLDAVVGYPLHRGVLALVRRPPVGDPRALIAAHTADPPTAPGRPPDSGHTAHDGGAGGDSGAAERTVARTLVVLEDVVDPDNVGAVFRHAAAFGVAAVLLTSGAGDPLYRKAVRTSMGHVLSVPWARFAAGDDWPALLHAAGLVTVALHPRGAAPLWTPLPSGAAVALVLGTESEGLRGETLERCMLRRSIPMPPGVDSLNVATTAAIALYERCRP